MIEEIKKELLNNPEKLKDVLEEFDYCNIVIRTRYMQFGRDENSSKKAISIRLEKNDYLYINDFARNINKEFFTYIIEQRHVEFTDVLNVVKSKLNITDYYNFFNKEKVSVFGGFYKNIRSKVTTRIITHDESILDVYQPYGNARFLRDNISVETQRFFGIGYDVESQCITIPIRNQFGELMGVKARCNWDVEDGEQKYYYLVPCQMSMTLYGYYQNYKYMTGETIYVFEAEKSVLQCHSYGIHNCVALGSGTISKQQVKMILELNPKRVVFMHDTGYALENIMRNIDMVDVYSRFSEIELGYWDYFDKDYQNKVSPSDLGSVELNRIICNEIKMIGEEDEI